MKQFSLTFLTMLCGLYSSAQKQANQQCATVSVNIDSVQHILCNGGSNGKATAFASGGTLPYSYLWSTAFTDSTHTGLLAGTYTVTVTDDASCTAEASITITEPQPLSITTDTSSAMCNDSSGTATAIVSGGTSPYTFIWDLNADSQTTQTATGLEAGIYYVTATDSNGCSIVDTVTIASIGGVTVSFTTTPDSCNSTGTTTATANGAPPYSYQWDSGTGNQTTQTATGLSAGDYFITITDDDGCSIVGTATIITTSGLFVQPTGTDENCGNGDGSASANASGGPTPYTYVWDDTNNSTTETVTGLSEGTYTVTVTDNSGCSVVKGVAINNVGSFSAFASTSLEHCGQGNGSATVGTAGGTMPFNYVWSDPDNQTTVTATGLTAGTYSVIVTDDVGCMDTVTVEVISTDGPLLNTPAPEPSCDSVTIIVFAGGSPPFTYLWNTGETNDTLTKGNIEETFYVTVTDNFGCTKTDSVSVSEITNCDELEVPTAFTPNSDGRNDIWILKGVENQDNLTVEIFTRWGQLVFSSTGYGTPWDGTFEGKNLPTGVYYYIITTLNNEPQHGAVTIVR